MRMDIEFRLQMIYHISNISTLTASQTLLPSYFPRVLSDCDPRGVRVLKFTHHGVVDSSLLTLSSGITPKPY